ncbi:uncharacterized protein LOC114797155 [Denticeps clupeoides]|uniref:uncharacterized protein LOC114797155 n=1 Tax=Denticeps clupeoides TaxID=299321 RepID=UPI0010A59AEB|nr:uncharacterized protein LOC114797155 [Denticeps clupeoides]
MMALVVYFVLFCAFSQCATAAHKGAVEVQCGDRFLQVLINLAYVGPGPEPRFEALDGTRAYEITQGYGSECGYTYQVFPMLGIAVFRASYFSCHTVSQDDEVFTFKFHLIMPDDSGKKTTYPISETCYLTLAWSPREVICELNYMEVTLKSVVPCPYTGGIIKDGTWNDALSTAHSDASAAWQLMFLKEGQSPTLMSLEQGQQLGYRVQFSPGRIVFRTPYGQPYSNVSMVNGVPVEVVHPTLFSRQRWSVLMVDLVAACNQYEEEFDGIRLKWKSPTFIAPLVPGNAGVRNVQINIGMNATLLKPQAIRELGYSVDINRQTVDIGIPYAAEGGCRKSFVLDNTYHEFYLARLYYEQVFMDDGGEETRYRVARVLSTPLLANVPFTINQTVIEERVFTIYVGNFKSDVELVAVALNGQTFTVPEAVQSGHTVTMLANSNGTRSFVIRVSFRSSVVREQYFTSGVLRYALNVNFTLSIMPQEDLFYVATSVMALFSGVFPPVLTGQCMENGISFQLDHQEFDYLWEVAIGRHALTQQLINERGYTVANDSQSLVLVIPLFSPGYTYEQITLQYFVATFDVTTRDTRTSAVQKHYTKRCRFETTQLIMCSAEGVMTVVSDVTKSTPKAIPDRTTLLDRRCKPKETDESSVLFEFGLDTCGTTFKVIEGYGIYENVIIFEEEDTRALITRDATFRLTVRCSYPLSDVFQLPLGKKFQSPGLGSVVKNNMPWMGNGLVKGPPQLVRPSSSGSVPANRKKPTARSPSVHDPATYVRVFSHPGGRRTLQTWAAPGALG